MATIGRGRRWSRQGTPRFARSSTRLRRSVDGATCFPRVAVAWAGWLMSTPSSAVATSKSRRMPGRRGENPDRRSRPSDFAWSWRRKPRRNGGRSTLLPGAAVDRRGATSACRIGRATLSDGAVAVRSSRRRAEAYPGPHLPTDSSEEPFY